MYAIYIPGRHPCGPKQRITFKHRATYVYQGFIWAKNFEGETGGRAGLMGRLGGPRGWVWEEVWPLLHKAQKA